jgi:hypothetical protein
MAVTNISTDPLGQIYKRAKAVVTNIIIFNFLFLKDYFNTTDPLHVCNLIIGMLCVVIGFSANSPNTCYRIKYKKIKIVKLIKFHVISGVVGYKSGLIYNILKH